MLKVVRVRKGSIASEMNLPTDSKLLAINGNKILDELDYKFHSSDYNLEFLMEFPNGEKVVYEFKRDDGSDIGLEFEPPKIRRCGNRCVFCFIDQLPKGLRGSLYIKDEDYRLSFLDGNFITLTSLGERDLVRIIEYHLSPLYVSVHTTNEKLRKLMLGRKRPKSIMQLLHRLTDGEIDIHTQIVLCPGFNDGDELKKTISDLAGLGPHIKSVGVVPVGLSRHRENLPYIKPVDIKKALEIIKGFGSDMQRNFRKQKEGGFVYLADEFYLIAGMKVPENSYYDDYPQLENGIGMVRSFLDDIKVQTKTLKTLIMKKHLRIMLITGKLMAPTLKRELLPRLGCFSDMLSVEIVPIANELLGESITVSGLLSGRDIVDGIVKNGLESDLVILPPNCINADGILLDDFTPKLISERTGVPIRVGSYNIIESILSALREFN